MLVQSRCSQAVVRSTEPHRDERVLSLDVDEHQPFPIDEHRPAVMGDHDSYPTAVAIPLAGLLRT
jgi:hypothetical protein